MIETNFIFVPVRKHNNYTCLGLPDHLPKIVYCIPERGLGDDVLEELISNGDLNFRERSIS